MASFNFLTIKMGKEGEPLREAVSISAIFPDKGEKVIELPSHYNGKPVLCIGYHQGKLEGSVRYHDWHHPAQGFDGYDPALYFAKKDSNFALPPRIKKIIFPAEIRLFRPDVFNKKKNIIYEVHPDNKFIRVEDNKLVYIPAEND